MMQCRGLLRAAVAAQRADPQPSCSSSWWPAASSFLDDVLQGVAGSSRSINTMVKTSVPKPRPEVADALSTFHGGHISRLIKFSESLTQLDGVLHKNRGALTPTHIAVAALHLEKLYKQERGSSLALKQQQVAVGIESFAQERAPRLTVSHIASILRGLTGANHQLSQRTLLALAASLIANNGQQLRFGSDMDFKDIIYGMAQQGFNNATFWQKVCDAAAPKVASWNVNHVASVVSNLAQAHTSHASLLDAAAHVLASQQAELAPAAVADAALGLAELGYSNKDVAHALKAAGLKEMAKMNARALSGFTSAMCRLHVADAALVKAAAAAAVPLVDSMALPHVARLARALTMFPHEDAQLYEALAQRAQQQLPRATPGLMALTGKVFSTGPAAKAEGSRKLTAEIAKKQQGVQ